MEQDVRIAAEMLQSSMAGAALPAVRAYLRTLERALARAERRAQAVRAARKHSVVAHYVHMMAGAEMLPLERQIAIGDAEAREALAAEVARLARLVRAARALLAALEAADTGETGPGEHRAVG